MKQTVGRVFLNSAIRKDRKMISSGVNGNPAGGIVRRGWWTAVNHLVGDSGAKGIVWTNRRLGIPLRNRGGINAAAMPVDSVGIGRGVPEPNHQ